MTDRYENIRRALAMGPTPGPWELKDGRTDTIENAQGYPVCTVHYHPHELYGHGVRAAYIAACDPDTIRALLAERDQLADALEAAREDAEPVVRFNDDGTLDEVVGRGQFHLEQMGSGHWWMQLGPHIVNLSARGKIRAHFGRNEAAIDQARGKGGKEDGND